MIYSSPEFNTNQETQLVTMVRNNLPASADMPTVSIPREYVDENS